MDTLEESAARIPVLEDEIAELLKREGGYLVIIQALEAQVKTEGEKTEKLQAAKVKAAVNVRPAAILSIVVLTVFGAVSGWRRNRGEFKEGVREIFEKGGKVKE